MNRATPPAAAERRIVHTRCRFGLWRAEGVGLRFIAALFSITAVLTTAGNASDQHAKSKSKPKRPSPGPSWADTNHDGQLSKEEFERAKQMLEEKIKKVKADTKTTTQ
jgi:hypothetical protein